MEVSEHLNWTERISEEQRFFHWKLEFPDVFEAGGFDAVIGNPPWEVLKLKEREYFAGRDLEIFSNKKTNERRLLIAGLEKNNPELFRSYMKELEQYSSMGNYISKRTLYSLTGKGELNTYQLFAELFLRMRKEEGRSGVIVPTGIATDKGNSAFFKYVVESKLLSSLADFVNASIFKNVHKSYRISLIVFARAESTRMLFMLKDPDQLYTKKFLHLSAEDLLLVNPNTGTAPVFSSQRDMDLVLKIYRNSKILLREYEDGSTDNPYGISVYRQFDMSLDSDKFVREQELIDRGYKKNWIYYEKENERYVPLCEGKTFYILDSRYNHIAEDGNGTNCTAQEKSDPRFFPKTRYYVKSSLAQAVLVQKIGLSNLLGIVRGIARSSDKRTLLFSLSIRAAFGDTAQLIASGRISSLASIIQSHIIDYTVRNKLQNARMNFFVIYQLPVPDPSKFKQLPGLDTGDTCLEDSVIRRLVKCVNYSYDMESFVKDMGYEIEPRPWNEKERVDYMAQLDAIAAHLYGIDYEDLKYIFTTFPIEKREQEREYGTYLSRDLALKYFEEYSPKLSGRK